MKALKTVLHYYEFNLTKATDKQAYDALSQRLKASGLKLFDSISAKGYEFYHNNIKPLDGKTITLETDYLFNNQWNTAPTKTRTKGLRVFDWAETIVPNHAYKIGMWLEQTTEMKAIRDLTLQCGYCGSFYPMPEDRKFCDKCLSSEYLKESELHLLRLLPVSSKYSVKRAPLSNEEKAIVVPLYIEAQTKGNKARISRKKEDLRHQYKVAFNNAKTKFGGFMWLLDHEVNTENVIYYDHTRKFCFGWRNPIDASVYSKLVDILVEFPFDYKIKKAGAK